MANRSVRDWRGIKHQFSEYCTEDLYSLLFNAEDTAKSVENSSTPCTANFDCAATRQAVEPSRPRKLRRRAGFESQRQKVSAQYPATGLSFKGADRGPTFGTTSMAARPDDADLRAAMLSVYYESLGRQFEIAGAPSVLLPPQARTQPLEESLEVLSASPARLLAALWLLVRGVRAGNGSGQRQ